MASGLVEVGLTTPAIWSTFLFILEELKAKSFPNFATLPTVLVAPYTKGKYNNESAPNLALFKSFLAASSFGSTDSSVSNCVGPIWKASPNVPIFSASPTNTSPAAPPTTAAPNLATLALSFNL